MKTLKMISQKGRGITLSPHSILYLDDEEELALPLLRVLKREGYQVDYFQNGEDAVKAGQEKQYDLLLLDIMLKNFNIPTHEEITSGVEVARLINQVRPTPFIFLSGRNNVFDMAAGLDMGATNYIPKPYDLTYLLATLRAFFRDYKRKALLREIKNDAEMTIGDIRIDLINRLVFIKDEEVLVQDKPLGILIYLAKNRERPVSKEELLQEVWGFSSTDGIPGNTVEVNISRLRTAIGDKYIRTARGEGYYLTASDT